MRPHEYTQASTLNLSHHCIRALGFRTFYKLQNLKVLDLSRNYLTTIGKESIYELPNLVDVNLTSNCLVVIGSRAFNFIATSTVPLKLDLSGHCLREISSGAFGESQFKLIDLSRNNISKMSGFNKLHHLTKLNISGNCLDYNDPTTKFNFRFYEIGKSINFSELDASNICLREVRERAFSNNNFQKIDLSRNSLIKINKNAFFRSKMKYLDLSYNRIWDLIALTGASSTNELDREFGFVQLLVLNVSYNNIVYLPTYGFEGVVLLQQLILSGNCLEWVQSNAFAGLSPSKGLYKMTHLNLSGLCIEHLPNESFSGLESVQTIDLSHNDLIQISIGAFIGIGNLTRLDIRENSIGQISESLLEDMHVGTVLTDASRICCALNRSDSSRIEYCSPLPDQFSSCDDLMANIPLQLLIWVVGISSLIGNMFVIIWRLQKYSTRVSDLLILNLSASDTLMGIYLCIIASFDTYYRGVYYQNAEAWLSGLVCKFAGILNLLSSEVSVFMLLIISIDRCLAIVFTFKSLTINLSKAKRIVGIGWIIMLILCIIPLLLTKQFDGFYNSNGVCMIFSVEYTQIDVNTRLSVTETGQLFTDGILIFNFLAFVVITIAYMLIFYKVQSVAKETSILRSTKKTNTEITIARKLVLILVTDFICWMPIILVQFVSRVSDVTMPANVSAWLAIFVLPLNSALNPFLFTVSAIKLRGGITQKKDKTSGTISSSVKTAISSDKVSRKMEHEHN